MKQKISLAQRNSLVKRHLNGESVVSLAKEIGVSRMRFYHWIKEYEIYLKSIEEQKKKLSPHKRQELVKRVAAGEEVVKIAKLYGISRKSIYKWYKRYESSLLAKKTPVFNDKKPVIEHYYKQIPEKYEEVVLDAVRKYPELSPHRLPYVLPHIGDKPLVGSHGIQNVLRRHDLSTYDKRVAYATEYRNSFVFSSLIERAERLFALFAGQSALSRKLIIRLGLGLSLFIGALVVLYGISGLANSLAGSNTWSMAMALPLLSLAIGMIFFLYSTKYYLSIALVLSFSRHENDKGSAPRQSLLDMLLGKKGSAKEKEEQISGLTEDISHIRLQRHPFVSIHLAMYNEKRVIERLLTAATSMQYDNYEVIVADDSTDEEAIALLKKWEHHPHVKIVHRNSREGYKGQALQHALAFTDKKAEFIMIFDADFIPYPDSITQFLKYFQSTIGSLSPQAIKSTPIAAVQGYQWHVLNKSENWLTRGVRSEYAGSYVVERSSIEVYGGLKQISGSVYMIRKDVVEQVGWGKSITEDFEFTLNMYEKGFKVVYTPYVQAPAEAVSTLKRLIRQRMRWAEGHSFNVKKMFWRLLASHNLTIPEKLEFVYLSPYYLQAAFFLLGTFCWLLSEAVFHVRLPFWTEVWGWSLILTNMISLPLVNLVGLFLEESDERDYLGLLSFVALSYVVAPFQGYAAVKGFLEQSEGPWFRTPKTGRITDTFIPGHFYRYLKNFFGKGEPAGSPAMSSSYNPYLALATSNNRFNAFSIMPKRSKLPRILIAILLIITTSLVYSSYGVPQALAASQNYYLHTGAPLGTPAAPTTSNYMNEGVPSASAGVQMRAQRNNMNSGTVNYTWYSDILPNGNDDAVLGTGQYQVNIIKNAGGPAANRIINFGIQLFLSNANGASQTQLMANTARINIGSNGNFTALSFNIGNLNTPTNITAANPKRIGFRIFWKNSTNDANTFTNLIVNNSSAPFVIIMPNFQVPEFPIKPIAIPIFILMPLLPLLVKVMQKKEKRRKKHIWEELADDMQRVFYGLTGYSPGYIEPDV